MNFDQLNAMLTGRIITSQNATFQEVAGYPIPGQEAYEYGGGFREDLKRYRTTNPFRYTYPGFNDGTEFPRRKRRKPSYAEYTPEAQAQLRDFNFRERGLLADPHIDRKRALDSDISKASKRQRLEVPEAELAPIPIQAVDVPTAVIPPIQADVLSTIPPPPVMQAVDPDPDFVVPAAEISTPIQAKVLSTIPPPPVMQADEPPVPSDEPMPLQPEEQEVVPPHSADIPPEEADDIETSLTGVAPSPPIQAEVLSTIPPPPVMQAVDPDPDFVVPAAAISPPIQAEVLSTTPPPPVMQAIPEPMPLQPDAEPVKRLAEDVDLGWSLSPSSKKRQDVIPTVPTVRPPPATSDEKASAEMEYEEPFEGVEPPGEIETLSEKQRLRRRGVEQLGEKEFLSRQQRRRRARRIDKVVSKLKRLGLDIPEAIVMPSPHVPPGPPPPGPGPPPPGPPPPGPSGSGDPTKPPKKPPLPPFEDPKKDPDFSWWWGDPSKPPKKPPVPPWKIPKKKPPVPPWKIPKKPKDKLPYGWHGYVPPTYPPKKPPLPPSPGKPIHDPMKEDYPYGWHGFVPPRPVPKPSPLPPIKPPRLPPIAPPWVYVPPLKPRPKPKPKRKPRPAPHRTTAKSIIIPSRPRPALHRTTVISSKPHPVPAKPTPAKPTPAPAKPAPAKVVYREGLGRGSGSDMKVAPSQQVSVAAPQSTGTATGQGARENSELIKKINELLKSQKDSKRKKDGNKSYKAAKKQYRDYRKKQLAPMNKQNKEIKKRELAKIRRMPAAVRAKMRKQLAEKLKDRSDKIKKKLPAKISSPAHLSELLKTGQRVLAV